MKKKRLINRFAAKKIGRIAASCAILSSILLLSIGSQAQDSYAWQASLDTIRQAAFYKIILTPDLVAKCRQDLPDLRIAGRDGKFIPYVLKSDLPVLSTDGFKEFHILSNRQIQDSTTEVVIEKGTPSPLNYLLLVMKNSSAHRTATLSGSDDRRKWYAIREHIELQEAGSDTADHFVQSVAFPSSSYHYFKMILDDKGRLPLFILKAGMYTRSLTNGMYQDLPDPAIRQKDSSDKHSYITLSYPEPYRIDKLDLGIQGPALYRRHVRIFETGAEGPNDTGHARTAVGMTDAAGTAERSLVLEITLDPLNTSFRFPPVKTSRLLIDISNEDNAPLLLQRATSSQLDQYLLAWLQPGSGYRLLAGNAHATAPEYDLKYFADTVSRITDEIRIGQLQPIANPKNPNPPAGKDHSVFLLWSIIAGVLLLLIFLSIQMVKAIPKKDA
jgi:hypothetical protein